MQVRALKSYARLIAESIAMDDYLTGRAAMQFC